MNWKAIFKGIGAAAAGGAFTSGAAVIQDGNINGKQVASAAIAGALVGIAAYFQQSPIKPKPKPQQSDPPPDPGPQG